MQDVVNHIAPESQRRGRYRTAYDDGALRHKLFGAGAKLSRPHPAAEVRLR